VRYLKDAIVVIGLVLLMPVLLMLFPVVLFVLAFRRAHWGIERGSWTRGTRWAWAWAWASRGTSAADTASPRRESMDARTRTRRWLRNSGSARRDPIEGFLAVEGGDF
jgi:hypothetical protein